MVLWSLWFGWAGFLCFWLWFSVLGVGGFCFLLWVLVFLFRCMNELFSCFLFFWYRSSVCWCGVVWVVGLWGCVGLWVVVDCWWLVVSWGVSVVGW